MRSNRFFFRSRLFAGLMIFGFAVIVWTCWIPFDEQRVMRAVPPSADIITSHEKLSSRLDNWLNFEITQSALQAAGVDQAETDTFIQSFAGRWIIETIGRRLSFFAVMPAMRPGGPPMVLLAGWSGWRGQVLRWIAELNILPDTDKVVCSDGRSIWQWRKTVGHYDQRLTMAFCDGVILLCLSEDGRGLEWIRRRIERGVPSGIPQNTVAGSLTHIGEDKVYDRFWFSLPSKYGRDWGGGAVTLSAERLALRGELPPLADLPAGRMDPGNIAEILYDDTAAAVVLPALVMPYLIELIPQKEQRLRETLNEWVSVQVNGDKAMVMALCAGERAGRVFGFRVPALLLTLPLVQPDVMQSVSDLIDRINRVTGVGVMLYNDSSQPELKIIGTTEAQSLFTDALPIEERPVATIHEDNLLLMTSRSVLKGNLEKRSGRWAQDISATGLGYVWIDLDSSARVLTHLAAVFRLAGMIGKSPFGASGGALPARLTPWLNALTGLGVVDVYLNLSKEDRWLFYADYTPRQ